MKKLVLTFSFFIFSLALSFADESNELTKDNNKNNSFEFSIGLSVSNNFYYNLSNDYKIENDNSLTLDKNSDEQIISLINFSLGLPINITYYKNDIFGIGFSNNLSFTITPDSIFPISLILVERPKMSLKIFKQKSFLSEFGLTLYCPLPININKNYSYAGPNIFLGYEQRFTKNFMITFGGFFEYLFSVTIFDKKELVYNYVYDEFYTKNYSHIHYSNMFSAGLEVRFKFFKAL